MLIMIIGVCGYGSSGASAVLALLNEFNDISIENRREIQILHEPDGLMDLKYQLVENKGRIACNAAISRYKRNITASRTWSLNRITKGRNRQLARQYADKLTQISWKGWSSFDPCDMRTSGRNDFGSIVFKTLNKIVRENKIKLHFPRAKTRYFSFLTEKEFDDMTKEYLMALFLELGLDVSKNLVLDQFFSATNPTKGFEFFEDPKAIVVDRDPRDLYLTAKAQYWTNGFMPYEPCEKFIQFYKLLYTKVEKSKNPNVLYVQYEDLIYDYEAVVEKISAFLGLKIDAKKQFSCFNPNISVKYTQRFKNTPYQEDIKKIESELQDWLYDFKEYNAIEIDSEATK